jgi:hypothetical protein
LHFTLTIESLEPALQFGNVIRRQG